VRKRAKEVGSFPPRWAPPRPSQRCKLDSVSLFSAHEAGGTRPSDGIRHLLGLSGSLLPELRSSVPARIGRFYPWLVFFTYGVLAILARASDDVPSPRAIVGSALVAMSWAAGLVAYGAARDRIPREERLRRLEAVAGHPVTPRDERLASILAIMRAVGRAVGMPALGLALVTLAFGASGPPWRALVLVGWVGLYASLFGVVVGGLASLARIVSPRFGRILFVLALVVPHFLPRSVGRPLSVVRGFSHLRVRVAGAGNAGSAHVRALPLRPESC